MWRKNDVTTRGVFVPAKQNHVHRKKEKKKKTSREIFSGFPGLSGFPVYPVLSIDLSLSLSLAPVYPCIILLLISLTKCYIVIYIIFQKNYYNEMRNYNN